MKVFKLLAIVAACFLASCSSATIEVISDLTEASSTEVAAVETTKVEIKTTTSEPKVETSTRAVEEISEPIEVVDSKPAEVIDNKPVELDSKPVEVVTEQEAAPVEATLNEAPANKRKVLYINQQQNGKLNVQLELRDVSVFIVPKHKDPQTSLLNLLFKNAQKPSNTVEDKKPFNGDYSKFAMPIASSSEENDRIAPNIESRTPYRVDISSTLGQTPVDIITQPPAYPHLKMMPAIVQSRQLFRRSIDTRLHEMDYNTQEQPFNEITDDTDYEETNFAHDGADEFVLLGAVENCGPGRRRNSYQICVAVD